VSSTAFSSNAPATPSRDASHDFPAIFFLDSVLFRRSVNQLPDANFHVEPDVLAFVGDGLSKQSLISSYFTLIHPWIPFLSRKYFMERVLNPFGSALPGNTLLIAAMKLVAMSPPESSPRSDIYTSIKATLLRAVTSSLLEFRLFQTMILLGVYELGHAIHPAAYMTIGSCIRYGNALGINAMAELDVQRAINNVESEERRRSWWAVLLLDR
jgi:hypothetical protein